jgi:alcohol dehydrogenase class IV
MSFYQFSVPTKIIHAEGMAKDFANEAQGIGVTRLFVITDAFLRRSGLCDPILKHLEESGIAVAGIHDDVPPDSSVKTVEACARLATESGADGFLAIGGGSVMDTAKGANILFTLGGNLKEDYSGAQTITQDLAPLIAIPTTAGTGSEVTEAIVIYDEESKSKLSFVDAHLLPRLAVLDPELTVGLPPLLTAATGMDAITHAMEAVMSVQNNPVSDALALQAVSYAREFLPRAVKNGSDIEARSKMLVASNLAGMAFNHAMVGVVHAVAHSVGALARVHHGTANGVFLPFGLEYNLETAADRIATMAGAFGCVLVGDDETRGRAVILAVRELIAELNALCAFPKTFTEAGVSPALAGEIAAHAVDDGASFYNPRPVTAEELLPFVLKAFHPSA